MLTSNFFLFSSLMFVTNPDFQLRGKTTLMKSHSPERTVFMKRQELQLWFSMSRPMIMKPTQGIILLGNLVPQQVPTNSLRRNFPQFKSSLCVPMQLSVHIHKDISKLTTAVFSFHCTSQPSELLEPWGGLNNGRVTEHEASSSTVSGHPSQSKTLLQLDKQLGGRQRVKVA